jgi:hypothetical protein
LRAAGAFFPAAFFAAPFLRATGAFFPAAFFAVVFFFSAIRFPP